MPVHNHRATRRLPLRKRVVTMTYNKKIEHKGIFPCGRCGFGWTYTWLCPGCETQGVRVDRTPPPKVERPPAPLHMLRGEWEKVAA